METGSFGTSERLMMPLNRIRLLKFIGVFAIGGTERHVVNLVRRLDASKFEPHMACFKRQGQFLQEIETRDIPISEYKIRSLYHHETFLQQLRFARFLRRNQIRVVHTYGFYPTVFAVPAARLARVPLVIASIRDTGELLTPFQKRVLKFVCRMADSILVNARAVRDWLVAEGYSPEIIEVIWNGIDLDRFETKGADGADRREWGLPAQAPLIAMMGRLNRLKGAEYFLEAAATVASRFPEVRFLVVGDVTAADIAYKEELIRQAGRHGLDGRIVFTGFRLDVPQVLSEVSISVLPSLSEGLSNVLLESMAAGVPVIATTVGGNPEVVEGGVTGLLVPPRDSKALAHAMSLLIEKPDLARQYGRAGKDRIAEHFHLGRMVRQTEQYYVDLLDQAARRQGFLSREAPI
jgi:glycosyltransferase involved in cell wall biosynthesis